MRESDLMVLVSPVYYGDLTAQAKGFVDRTYSYYLPDFISNPRVTRLSPGRKMVMILTQAHPDEKMFKDIYPKYDLFFSRHNYRENHLIRACGVMEKGDIKRAGHAFEQADQIAARLLSSQDAV